jgi:hypothetical protein
MRNLILSVVLTLGAMFTTTSVKGQTISDFAENYKTILNLNGFSDTDVSYSGTTIIVNIHANDISSTSGLSLARTNEAIKTSSFRHIMTTSFMKGVLSEGSKIYKDLGIYGFRVDITDSSGNTYKGQIQYI